MLLQFAMIYFLVKRSADDIHDFHVLNMFNVFDFHREYISSSTTTVSVPNTLDFRPYFVKYYYLDSSDIFKFFEDCPIADWAKNSPEHYFMNQLQLNRNGNRVWNCSSAEMVVIPLSLGNWYRNRCGLGAKWKSTLSDKALVARVNQRIFGDPNSCWNTEPRTRPFHLLLIGDWKGRQYLKFISKLRVPNGAYPAQMWFRHKFVFVDTWSDSWVKSKKAMVTLSNGFTSVASYAMTRTKPILNATSSSTKALKTNISKYQLGPNKLPEITIHSNFSEWKQRKFTLFLMGQADDREAYTLRRVALEQLPFDNNVLIQTTNSDDTDNWRFTECQRTFGEIVNFPCSMRASAEKYLYYLTQSRFNLMFRGDEPCSSRFYDALAFNVINIVISDGFDGCVIGRTLITKEQQNLLYLTVKEKDFKENATESIYREIDKFNDSHFERMLKEIEKMKPYLLWDSYRSETAEMVLFEAFMKVNRPYLKMMGRDRMKIAQQYLDRGYEY